MQTLNPCEFGLCNIFKLLCSLFLNTSKNNDWMYFKELLVQFKHTLMAIFLMDKLK